MATETAEFTVTDNVIFKSNSLRKPIKYVGQAPEYNLNIQETVVEKIDDSVIALAGGAGTKRGTGGMRTKINAAQMVTESGIDMYITNGRNPENIYDILEGKQVGTLFKSDRKQEK